MNCGALVPVAQVSTRLTGSSNRTRIGLVALRLRSKSDIQTTAMNAYRIRPFVLGLLSVALTFTNVCAQTNLISGVLTESATWISGET